MTRRNPKLKVTAHGKTGGTVTEFLEGGYEIGVSTDMKASRPTESIEVS